MDKSIACIVYACDDHFVEILGVSLVSLFENSKDMNEIIIYIFENSVTNINKKKIESIFKLYKRSNPIWIQSRDIAKELGIRVFIDRGSLVQYARFFISRDITKDLDRILYLDCDTIFKKSIKELWIMDMHGKTVAGLKEAISKYYRRNVDLNFNDVMFNSGVMLVDLKKWRKYNIEEKLLHFVSERNGKIQYADQGALNAILSHDTYCFEPKFNSITVFYDFTYKEMMIYRKPSNFYTEQQINDGA